MFTVFIAGEVKEAAKVRAGKERKKQVEGVESLGFTVTNK